MQGLKAFRIFLVFAALLFVAKPFFGFGIYSSRFKPHISHNILVKSFTKRKPESLEDADANVSHIHQQLSNPVIILFPSISLLLLTLFPLLFSYLTKITGRALADIQFAILPPQRTYLLAGKLII